MSGRIITKDNLNPDSYKGLKAKLKRMDEALKANVILVNKQANYVAALEVMLISVADADKLREGDEEFLNALTVKHHPELANVQTDS